MSEYDPTERTERLALPSGGQEVYPKISLGQSVKFGLGFGCGMMVSVTLVSIIVSVVSILLIGALGVSLSNNFTTSP